VATATALAGKRSFRFKPVYTLLHADCWNKIRVRLTAPIGSNPIPEIGAVRSKAAKTTHPECSGPKAGPRERSANPFR
jgi:hypothetical protein